MIADAERPSAVAGLMGSEWSEVTDETTTRAARVRQLRRLRHPGLVRAPGPSHRGIQPVGEGPRSPPPAAARCALASQLMVELAGATLVPGTIDIHGELPEPPVVPLRRQRLEQVIGVRYTDAEIDRALARLGYEPDRRRLARAHLARRRHDPRDRPGRGGRAGRTTSSGCRPRCPAARRGGRPAGATTSGSAARRRRAARRRAVGVGDADALGRRDARTGCGSRRTTRGARWSVQTR